MLPHPPQRSYLTLVAVLLSTSSCGYGTHWSSEQSWTSTHFIYHARPDDSSVGPEVLEYLEENADLVARSQLGLDPTAWGPVDYFKYRDADDFAANAPCGQGEGTNIGACTLDYSTKGRIEVHSPSAIHGHELVHGYAYSFGYPPTLLMEGLAVALSCDPGVETADLDFPEDRIDLGTWQGLLDWDFIESPNTYVSRGVFVAWLIDHRGIQPLLEVYKEVAHDATAAELAASFQAHYGESLDALWQAASTEPRRRTCTSVSSCTVLDGTASPLARTYPAVPIPTAGLLVSTPNGFSSRPAVRVCNPASASTHDREWPGEGGTTTLFLGATVGTVLTPSSDSIGGWERGPVPAPDYQATTPLDPSWVGTSCAGTTPIPVVGDSVSLQIWPSDSPRVFQLQPSSGAGQSSVQAFTGGSQAPVTVDVCTDCQAGVLTGCMTISGSFQNVNVPVSNPWLRVQWSGDTDALLNVAAQF